MFSGNAFSKASFSVNAFKMAEEANKGRSGYWRLFYYNLQEESLKADAKRQAEPTPEIKTEFIKAKPVAKPKVKNNVRVEKEVVKFEDTKPPVRVLPIYKTPAWSEVPDITPFLSIISAEFRTMLMRSEPIRLAMLQRVAANDDEEDIEMLLLAA